MNNYVVSIVPDDTLAIHSEPSIIDAVDLHMLVKSHYDFYGVRLPTMKVDEVDYAIARADRYSGIQRVPVYKECTLLILGIKK